MEKGSVEVNDLSKVYHLYNKSSDRLRETFSIKKKKYSKDHYALRDINLSIKHGESVGIVGTNGSGKSTLLKLITGVVTPTTGEIKTKGKIAALLELGAGFNPEYTGIENIYLNGTMMGYTEEEMEKRVPGIVDFADIGEFIHQPVKSYSSGMFARLAFAVAINVDADILLVDEILAVGDQHFQEKCIAKMKELKAQGKTMVFVTHSMGTVKEFCTRAVWLCDGVVKMDGKPDDVIEEYLKETL